MASGQRTIFVILPILITLAAFILLIVVGLGGTNANSANLSNIYFLSINTTTVTANPQWTQNVATSLTPAAAKTANGDILIENFYTASLWNYCAGSGNNLTSGIVAVGNTGPRAVDFCSSRSLKFIFNPVAAWGVNFTNWANLPTLTADQNANLVNDINIFMNVYLSKFQYWISTTYILAVTFLVAELLLGISAFFSRIGSALTTFMAVLATVSTIAFAVVATVAYKGLSAMFAASIGFNLGVTSALGVQAFAMTFIAAVFTLVSAIMFSVTACCCAPRPRHREVAEVKAGSYSRIEPAFGGQPQMGQVN